jgi:hypothetical protein
MIQTLAVRSLLILGSAIFQGPSQAFAEEYSCTSITGSVLDALMDAGAAATNAVRASEGRTSWWSSTLADQLINIRKLIKTASEKTSSPIVRAKLELLIKEVDSGIRETSSAFGFHPKGIARIFIPIERDLNALIPLIAESQKLGALAEGDSRAATQGREHLAAAILKAGLSLKMAQDGVAWWSDTFGKHLYANLQTVKDALSQAQSWSGIYSLKKSKEFLEWQRAHIDQGSTYSSRFVRRVFTHLNADIEAAIQAEGL